MASQVEQMRTQLSSAQGGRVEAEGEVGTRADGRTAYIVSCLAAYFTLASLPCPALPCPVQYEPLLNKPALPRPALPYAV